MILVIVALIVLICLFISIVNFYYQKQKYKYSTDEEMKRLSLLESPSTWGICTIIFTLALLGTFFISVKYVAGGFSNIQKQENTINQYQNDLSDQSIDSEQTNEKK